MQVAYDYRHLANRSAKCKSLSAVWRTSPRNARGFLPFGERLREMQEPFRHLANVSCNLRETIVPLHTISCNLRETIVPLQTSPAICGRPSYPYKHLLQLAGDYRTPTNHLLQSAGDLRTPTNHLLQSAGDLRTPTKKCFSFFFRLRFVLLIESPTFVSLKYNTQKR